MESIIILIDDLIVNDPLIVLFQYLLYCTDISCDWSYNLLLDYLRLNTIYANPQDIGMFLAVLL